MKTISSNTKSVIVFIVILLIGVLIYFYTLGSPNDSMINSIDQTAAIGDEQTQIAAARILALLNEMSVLKIDKAVFSDPLYSRLLDHTVAIPPQNIGRANPFAPYYAPARTVTRTR